MAWYEVEVRTVGREVYSLEADSPEEAEQFWMDGSPFVSEVLDTEVERVLEVD